MRPGFPRPLAPFLILFGLLLVACGDPALPDEPASTSEPAGTAVERAPTPAPSPTATHPPDSATLAGTVLSASDVGDRPATPLSDQLILLLPAGQAPEVLGVPSEDEVLRFLSTTVPQPPPALTALRTGSAGTFSLTTAPGAYVLCLADAAGTGPTSPPFQTRGCARLTLTPGQTLEVEISTMFGEILLTAPS